MCLRPVLRPRRARPARPLRQVGTAPRASDYGGSPREVISGLNGRALALAVYASQGGSLHHHARLTSSRWPDSTGRDCIPAGFQRKVSKWFSPSRPPFLSFLGAADVPVSSPVPLPFPSVPLWRVDQISAAVIGSSASRFPCAAAARDSGALVAWCASTMRIRPASQRLISVAAMPRKPTRG